MVSEPVSWVTRQKVDSRHLRVKCQKCNDEFVILTRPIYLSTNDVDALNAKQVTIEDVIRKAHGSYLCASCDKKEEQDREKLRAIELQEKMRMNSGIPARWQNSELLTQFKTGGNKTALNMIQAHIPPQLPESDKAWDNVNWKSFVLYSPNLFGVGKTHLLCGLGMTLINQDRAVHYATEVDLMMRLRNTFNNSRYDGETELSIYQNVLRNDYLFIDDVGKVKPRDGSFLQGVYFYLIDKIYNEDCAAYCLGIATNLTLEELGQHIGGACEDRLTELCGRSNLVRMTGKSHRG